MSYAVTYNLMWGGPADTSSLHRCRATHVLLALAAVGLWAVSTIERPLTGRHTCSIVVQSSSQVCPALHATRRTRS